jgi:hypothetical protein
MRFCSHVVDGVVLRVGEYLAMNKQVLAQNLVNLERILSEFYAARMPSSK